MITKKTVLVLGAGASKAYEFPLGRQLVRDIRISAGSPERKNWCIAFLEFLQSNAPEEVPPWSDLPSKMERLSKALGMARPASIDQFLALRPDIANAGKLEIAIRLLQAEQKSRDPLQDDSTDGHWYDFVKSQMVGPIRVFGENQLRIITFNYDRSLEHWLYESLWPYYSADTSEEEYRNVMNQIPILHIYGSLGPLPWQSVTGIVGYGAQGYAEILIASKSIKVLHEGTAHEVNDNFRKAQEWMRWANRIVFLGFGFHPDNVERLGLRDVLKGNKRITATCKGLDLTNKEAVEFCTGAPKSRPSVNFPDSKADCYTLLHDYVVLS